MAPSCHHRSKQIRQSVRTCAYYCRFWHFLTIVIAFAMECPGYCSTWLFAFEFSWMMSAEVRKVPRWKFSLHKTRKISRKDFKILQSDNMWQYVTICDNMWQYVTIWQRQGKHWRCFRRDSRLPCQLRARLGLGKPLPKAAATTKLPREASADHEVPAPERRDLKIWKDLETVKDSKDHMDSIRWHQMFKGW